MAGEIKNGIIIITTASNGVDAGKAVSVGQALVYALVGILVVFAVLFLLYLILTVFGKVSEKLASKKAVPVAEAAPASVPEETGCKLVDVDEKTAAMIMAIVADESGIAPERLHFEYIKCVEDK